MTIMIAIQTSLVGRGFVTEDERFPFNGLAHRYAPLDAALLFASVDDAVEWIERTAFYNGKHGRSYSPSLRLVRVKQDSSYRVLGPA